MIVLVVGECNCTYDAVVALRKCGYMEGRDYERVNRAKLKQSNLFKARPDLYTVTCSVLYDRENGKFINLRNIQLTQEVRRDIDGLFSK